MDDQIWFEVAYVAGITNGLNAVADGLKLPLDFSPCSRQALALLVDEATAAPEVRAVLAEIRDFYAADRPPAVFRYVARDPGFLRDYWTATREAFADRKLDRLTKEVLALAASLTARSDYGVDLHLREARRLGLTDAGLTEAIEVVQCFNTVTKIAEALQLQPDFDPRAAGRPGPA
ncbi:MAG: carboxymuconolactone decarboxylase family protein [Candidatus Rokubacteria bacterium]|nr:carboxymuconolactone decarboxylase family protein [Candidatus Rokubacteria bacterium]